jgi:hypothetical protein
LPPPGFISRKRLSGNEAVAEEYVDDDRMRVIIGISWRDFNYNSAMADAKKLLDETFLEMRWRCLSLAADLDRLDRGGSESVSADTRIVKLRRALSVLLESAPNRAERVQMIFSDMTPPPAYGKK